MSDFLKSTGVNYDFMSQDVFELFMKNRNIIGEAFMKQGLGEGSILPVCPICKTGTRKKQKKDFKNSKINACCDKCEEDYRVETSKGDDNFLIFYGLVGLRDILNAQKQDSEILHFFGADFVKNWGETIKIKKHTTLKGINNIPNTPSLLQRVDIILKVLGYKNKVVHAISPLIKFNGKKLSKSNNHYYLDRNAKKIIDFKLIEQILNKGELSVDIKNFS